MTGTRMTRRAALAAGLVTASTPYLFGEQAYAATVSVTAHPASPTVVIVLVTGLSGTGIARVLTTAGHQLGTSSIVAGRALVRVPVASGSTSTLVLTAPGVKQSFQATASPAAVAASVWRFVDKVHPLPSSFAPSPLQWVGGYQLRSDAAAAYTQLRQAAAKAGLGLGLCSAYRSYSTQVATYDHWVSVLGRAGADKVSARPGFSEHQTGLAMDVIRPDGYCTLESCFGGTSIGRWVAAHCYQYGLIVRYEQGQQGETGYSYEPWHLRYLGVPMATD